MLSQTDMGFNEKNHAPPPPPPFFFFFFLGGGGGGHWGPFIGEWLKTPRFGQLQPYDYPSPSQKIVWNDFWNHKWMKHKKKKTIKLY